MQRTAQKVDYPKGIKGNYSSVRGVLDFSGKANFLGFYTRDTSGLGFG